MRIAQISPLAEAVPPKLYGGTERVVSWLTEELVRQGHDVTLFASGDSETGATLVPGCEKGLRLLGVRDHTAHNLVMLDRVRKIADQFDIIHCHIDVLQYPMFQDLSHKLVTTLHGRLDLPDYYPVFEEYPQMPLVSISDSQREPMVPGVNWVDTVYHGLPSDVAPYNAKGGDYLAFLGRISPEKRPDRAIEIAKRAGVRLKIAAKVDKADQEYYDEVIEPLLDHPLIEFIGEIDERQKVGFLGNAMALLFPIDWREPFGLVMIEAMSAGTPVVAWKNGSVPEVIADGVGGVIVESMDAAVAGVERVRGFDRRKVRDYFESRFTAERMASNYLAAYKKVIDSGARPPQLVAAE
ncbi:glycosyltransferase family 4 protein [Enterovirga rhinocerotis]|uniref:Glycosyltransferase involved in cell wall biosynthesis n=1 Tax=Enterovirga rhinocerotis TaxID=1339210 RepID=A0A4R7BXX6_9HYPH|nr:glycosyltransferase family 4 protein [Enterovirga rhinocerotis]TDR90451.1 glycosyltransferase involved in cell wall biosynthesis [Enterovirga rhinocerotis]